MTRVAKAWTLFLTAVGVFLLAWFFNSQLIEARNISQYKDTISDSAPTFASNHTLSFMLDTAVAAGASFEITMPSGFETLATSTFFG